MAAFESVAELTPDISAVRLQRLLRAGAVSAVTVAAWYLQRARDFNPLLGAFSQLTGQQALEQALRLDEQRARHPERPVPPLWGIPLGHKDLVDVAGVATTHGSRAFAGSRAVPATADDPLVALLGRAGAVSLGKTQVPEFGLSGYSENLIAAPARNPYALHYSAGGSSGGAAAAVAAQLLPLAPGSDAGGSIRLPAACCGLVGLKPGRNQLPTDAAAAQAASGLQLAVQGPLARNVADATLLFEVMRGAGAVPLLPRVQLAGQRRDTVPRLRVAVSFASAFGGELEIVLAAEVERAVRFAAAQLRRAGHAVEFVDFRFPPGYFAAFYDFWTHNFGAAGFSEQQVAEFSPYARHCYERGRAVSPQRFAAAVARLRVVAQRAQQQWRGFDVVLQPVLNVAPRPVGFYEAAAVADNFRLQCEAMPFTSLVNVTGDAALALPVPGHEYVADVDPLPTTLGVPAALQTLLRTAGRLPGAVLPARATAAPVGVQLLAPAGQEELLLLLGAELEASF